MLRHSDEQVTYRLLYVYPGDPVNGSDVSGDIAYGLTDVGGGGTDYKVANAERLCTANGPLPRYDMVISRATMNHLVDPLGMLAQMADQVGSRGYLCVDEFYSSKRGLNCEVGPEPIMDAL